jgi:WhiB family redox-sensing transcriptional regulator
VDSEPDQWRFGRDCAVTIMSIDRDRACGDSGDSGWASRGTCARMDPDAFFVQGADQQKIKTACAGCPVRMECLADALDNQMEFGVWGGMTERERRRLLRAHPQIEDWYTVLKESAVQAASH